MEKKIQKLDSKLEQNCKEEIEKKEWSIPQLDVFKIEDTKNGYSGASGDGGTFPTTLS